MISCSSARLPIVEPRIESSLKKMRRMLIVASPPVVAPQVTRRPPRASDFFWPPAVGRLAEDAGACAERIVSAQTGDADASRIAGRHDDLIAGLPAESLQHLFDDSSHLGAGDHRQRELVPRHTAAKPDVE